MERDRSGILFSNILRQVRGRIHYKEQLGSVENNMALAFGSQNGANGYRGRVSNRPDTSFFKTSTDQINYKQILGFEVRRDDEEEIVQMQ